MSENLLTINQLNAFFGAKQVLFDVSFTVKTGQKMALVGESGSGKTVCAQSIIRLNPDVRLNGEVIFDGKPVLDLTQRELGRLRGQEIGMVFQEPMNALNPVLTVGAQIAEVFRYHQGLSQKEAWQEAVRLLTLTGIEDAQTKALSYPFALSGGQRQRAMIAMAIAGEPKLLIADEPTTALDVAVQGKILNLLSDLQQQFGMAILYITHDLGLVKRFADEVVVMKSGCVVERGQVKTVFSKPQHEYTKMLLDSQPEPLQYNITERKKVFSARQLGFSVGVKAGLLRKKQVSILRNIDFDLFEGQTLGVIGESGSGKTTLARIMLRLYQPFSGAMTIDDLDWSALDRQQLQQARHLIQIVFQDPFGALNPRMTIFDIITEGIRIKDSTGEALITQARQVLEEVGLPEDCLDRYPHEFSGGQRQRIAIARAIIMNPKILVLDEPTSALDVSLQKQIILLLLHLQQTRKLTMMIISHDLSVIRALSHQVLVLKDGEIVEQGDAQTLFLNPNNTYTKNLLNGIHG